MVRGRRESIGFRVLGLGFRVVVSIGSLLDRRGAEPWEWLTQKRHGTTTKEYVHVAH